MFNPTQKELNTPLFIHIPEDIIEAIQNDPLHLQGNFYINGNMKQQIKAVLSSQYLTLTEVGWFDRPYHYYVRLQFDLKFQVLRQGENGLGKALGFKLLRGGALPVEMRFSGQGGGQVWLSVMSRLLNQYGFHKFFKPVKKLGKGGFATVYQVQRLTDGQHFAVKAFSKQTTLLSQNVNHRLTLLNEIQIMRALDSPFVIKLEAVFESDNSLYVVLELLSAGQLHTRINRREGHFSMAEVRRFMVGLMKGLLEIHTHRIMHRDIKPENIMLRGENALQPVIADFGLAAFVDADDYLFYRCGTPGYVAPQITILAKGEKADPVCDIFSAGAIFHVLLVRRPLFQGRKFEEVYQNNRNLRFDLNGPLYKDVDPLAMDLLKRMLQANPKKRIRADEVLQHPFLRGWVMEDQKEVALARTLASSRAFTEN